MIKLLLKYMAGLLTLGMVSLIILYCISSHLQTKSTLETIQLYNQGIFATLQAQLQSYPATQWPAVIKTLRPPAGNPLTLMPLKQVKLTNKDMQQLNQHHIVTVIGQDKYYFGYGLTEIFSYQKVGNSNFVLRLAEIPLTTVSKHVSAWIVQLIKLQLLHTPLADWPTKANELTKTFGMPLTVMRLSDPSLSSSIIASLKDHELVIGKADASGKIDYAYINPHNYNTIIRIGPIPYPSYPFYQTDILIALFAIIVILFILLLTYIFSRNLDQIYRITENYSRGDFTAVKKFSRHSTLRVLHDNICKMGNKLQGLLQSQRNLTRFIAHECRTPISTMLFAIDSLEHENLSPAAKQHITNIKTDLHDLKNLVSNFLTYVRYSSQEIPLNYQSVALQPWLQDCINKYRFAPKKIFFSFSCQQTFIVTMDIDLMKHVITNLVDNAQKHAATKIQVQCTVQNTDCVITIEDDGLIISDTDKSTIFEPFVSLENYHHEHAESFGLGLTIAETIVKRHQGSLSVSNSSLGGTCFSLTLPCKQ